MFRRSILVFRNEMELGITRSSEKESHQDGGNVSSNDNILEIKGLDIKESSPTKRLKKFTFSKHENNIKVRNNFTYMFITIIIFYLLSYLPTFIVILLATGDPFHYWYSMDIVTLNFIMLLRRSSIINHIVNPFIYGYFDRAYRKFFLECFVCKNS